MKHHGENPLNLTNSRGVPRKQHKSIFHIYQFDKKSTWQSAWKMLVNTHGLISFGLKNIVTSSQCHVQKDGLWKANLNGMACPQQCQVCLCCCPMFNIFSVLANSREIRPQCVCCLWFRWQTVWTLQRASQSQTLQHLLTTFCWWPWSTNSLFVDRMSLIIPLKV